MTVLNLNSDQDAALVAKVIASDAFRKVAETVAQEEEAARARRHEALVVELEAAETQGRADLAKLDAKRARAAEAAEKALAAAHRASVELAHAQAARSRARDAHERHIGQLRSQLKQAADPRIAAAIRSNEQRIEKLRADGVYYKTTFSGRVLQTNERGFRAVHDMLVENRRFLAELQFAHVADVAGAIEAIEARVPWGDLRSLDRWTGWQPGFEPWEPAA